ncbi:unnamed protein product [Prunus armeniaca]
MWLSKVTKEVQPLAQALADAQAVALGPIFLAYFYRGLHEIILPKPMSCNVSGPIWLFQLWLKVYLLELGLANVTFRGDSLLRKSIASLPLPKHQVEDCFPFFYGCSQRSPSDLSMCLDHRYIDYLALDLTSVPTLETKEERRELWASILVSRDLPFGLALNKWNHYPCGCEIYYPTAIGYQMGFIQGVPSPMVDSHNHFCSWRVSFKKVCETCNPEFGYIEFSKAWWEKMSATWFSQPPEPQKRQVPTPVLVRVRRGHFPPPKVLKRIGTPLAMMSRFHKLMNHPCPIEKDPEEPIAPRIVEQPNPTHSTTATHSAESCIPIFEAEVGGQTVTSKAKVEKAVIGANPSTNPDVNMAETQHVTQPLGSREVDRGVVDDPSHILDHQFLLVLRPPRLTQQQSERKFKFYWITPHIPETQPTIPQMVRLFRLGLPHSSLSHCFSQATQVQPWSRLIGPWEVGIHHVGLSIRKRILTVTHCSFLCKFQGLSINEVLHNIPENKAIVSRIWKVLADLYKRSTEILIDSFVIPSSEELHIDPPEVGGRRCRETQYHRTSS